MRIEKIEKLIKQFQSFLHSFSPAQLSMLTELDLRQKFAQLKDLQIKSKRIKATQEKNVITDVTEVIEHKHPKGDVRTDDGKLKHIALIANTKTSLQKFLYENNLPKNSTARFKDKYVWIKNEADAHGFWFKELVMIDKPTAKMIDDLLPFTVNTIECDILQYTLNLDHFLLEPGDIYTVSDEDEDAMIIGTAIAQIIDNDHLSEDLDLSLDIDIGQLCVTSSENIAKILKIDYIDKRRNK